MSIEFNYISMVYKVQLLSTTYLCIPIHYTRDCFLIAMLILWSPQFPILLPRASRNFPNVKTRNKTFFYNWTFKIIPFIRFGKQMYRKNWRQEKLFLRCFCHLHLHNPVSRVRLAWNLSFKVNFLSQESSE